MVEYTIAGKNVQFEKGTLLETTNLFITGGGGSMNFALPVVPPEVVEDQDSDSELGDDIDDLEEAADDSDLADSDLVESDLAELNPQDPAVGDDTEEADDSRMFRLDFDDEPESLSGNAPPDRMELPLPLRSGG